MDRYQTSLYCSASRLAIRFGADAAEVQAALPAAFLWAGEWLGLVQQGTR